MAIDMPWKLRDALEDIEKDNTNPLVVSFVLLCEEMI